MASSATPTTAGTEENGEDDLLALTPDEQQRLEELDSRCYGLMNLQLPQFAKERALLLKAIKVLERRLLCSVTTTTVNKAATTDGADVDMEKQDSKQESATNSDVVNADATQQAALYKTYSQLGHVHLLAGDFPKALSAFQKANSTSPDLCWKDSPFFYGLGLVYFHFRIFEQALEAFQRVLYTAPYFERITEVHLRLGIIYKSLEDFDRAIKHFNCALADCGQCSLSKPEIRFHIGHCYENRGDLDRANYEYRDILVGEQQGHYPLTQQLKACLLRQLGWINYRAAGDLLDNAQVEQQQRRVQRLHEAEQLLQQSLHFDLTNGKTYYYLGRCYGAIPGKAHDAFVNYRQSIDKSEADADTWCSIGVLYQQQNQSLDALQAYICAVQLDGRHSAAWTDLGLLYEQHHQYEDALQCYRSAVKFKPVAPQALKLRIQLLETELKTAPPVSVQREQAAKLAKAKSTPVPVSLPDLEKAWKLPIPAELTQRQEEFLQAKFRRYKDGSPLLTMGTLGSDLDPSTDPCKSTCYLTTQQIQLLNVLQQNQSRLDAQNLQLLQTLSQKYALMQTDMRRMEEHKKITQQQPLQSVKPASADLPVMTQEDIANILGGTHAPSPLAGAVLGGQQGNNNNSSVMVAKRRSSANEDDLLLGGLVDTGDSSSKNDPMLGSAALIGKQSTSGLQQSTMLNEQAGRLQEQRVSSTSDTSFIHPSSHATKPSLVDDWPAPLNLLAKVKVSPSIASTDLMRMCCAADSDQSAIYEEIAAPPRPPKKPTIKPEDKEHLLLPTPLILVENRKDATASELQQYCYNAPIALIRGLTAVLRIDLSLFSTKTLMEVAPDHEVEVRTQYQMPPDSNVDHLGEPSWYCESSPSATTIVKYAQYQAQSFQHSLKEEQEKLRAGVSMNKPTSSLDTGDSSSAVYPKKRRANHHESPMPMKILKFGTNVDLSDEQRWRTQLTELSKMPAFCRLVAGCNLLTHLEHTILGMNTVQLYMKVPGCRTPGHQENNSFASVNVNIGPGECEWFGVPHEYWGAIHEMCRKRGINYLKGSWWPNLDDLYSANIPVYRFTQKAGDVVWVGGGCVHWVQATGWCNNVAWNVGPMTANQIELALETREWNRLQSYKSLVPMQHLCWQLARNVKFTNAHLYETVRRVLIRSLVYCRRLVSYVESMGKRIRHHPRAKGDVAHYCDTCEVEVFNVLFVMEQQNKYVVHCADCARRADPQLNRFIILQQYTFQELVQAFDACTLHPPRPGVIS